MCVYVCVCVCVVFHSIYYMNTVVYRCVNSHEIHVS